MALASRSGYVQSWSRKDAIGLCGVPVGYEDDLAAAGIILQQKDLFCYENNIKAAEFVWGIVWKAADGNINKALNSYFYKDDPGAIKIVIDNYWKFVYICRRPSLPVK